MNTFNLPFNITLQRSLSVFTLCKKLIIKAQTKENIIMCKETHDTCQDKEFYTNRYIIIPCIWINIRSAIAGKSQ